MTINSFIAVITVHQIYEQIYNVQRRHTTSCNVDSQVGYKPSIL